MKPRARSLDRGIGTFWAELCRPLSLARCIFRYRRAFHPGRSPTAGEPISMRNHSLESRVREKRTHGSEGGEGERPFLPLSVGGCFPTPDAGDLLLHLDEQ